jgi:hypothetical protein
MPATKVCPDLPSGHFVLEGWKPDTHVEEKLAKLSRALLDNPFCGFDRQTTCSAILTIRDEQRNLWIDAQADMDRIYREIAVINTLTGRRYRTNQNLMDAKMFALKHKVVAGLPQAQEDLHAHLLNHPRHVEVLSGHWGLLALKYKYLFFATLERNQSVEFTVRAEKLVLHHFPTILRAEIWWKAYKLKRSTQGMMFVTLRK